MKRVSADVLIFGLFLVQYFFFEVLGDDFASGIWFLILNPTLTWIVLAILLALWRAFLERRFFRSKRAFWLQGIEWVGVVLAANVATCWVDVLLHSHESFWTVFGFNLLIVVVPSLVLSTTAYLVALATWPRPKPDQLP
jgi:hypothetical protein